MLRVQNNRDQAALLFGNLLDPKNFLLNISTSTFEYMDFVKYERNSLAHPGAEQASAGLTWGKLKARIEGYYLFDVCHRQRDLEMKNILSFINMAMKHSFYMSKTVKTSHPYYYFLIDPEVFKSQYTDLPEIRV